VDHRGAGGADGRPPGRAACHVTGQRGRNIRALAPLREASYRLLIRGDAGFGRVEGLRELHPRRRSSRLPEFAGGAPRCSATSAPRISRATARTGHGGDALGQVTLRAPHRGARIGPLWAILAREVDGPERRAARVLCDTRPDHDGGRSVDAGDLVRLMLGHRAFFKVPQIPAADRAPPVREHNTIRSLLGLA